VERGGGGEVVNRGEGRIGRLERGMAEAARHLTKLDKELRISSLPIFRVGKWERVIHSALQFVKQGRVGAILAVVRCRKDRTMAGDAAPECWEVMGDRSLLLVVHICVPEGCRGLRWACLPVHPVLSGTRETGSTPKAGAWNCRGGSLAGAFGGWGLMAGFAGLSVASPLPERMERQGTASTPFGNGAWGLDGGRRYLADLPPTVLPCSSFRDENRRTRHTRVGYGKGGRDLWPRGLGGED
jgi:hypothetical protein